MNAPSPTTSNRLHRTTVRPRRPVACRARLKSAGTPFDIRHPHMRTGHPRDTPVDIPLGNAPFPPAVPRGLATPRVLPPLSRSASEGKRPALVRQLWAPTRERCHDNAEVEMAVPVTTRVSVGTRA